MLVLVGLVALAFGVKGLVTGAPGNVAVVRRLTGLEWDSLRARDPGMGRLVTLLARHEALVLLGWGAWLVTSAVHGYRGGERWPWTVWWTVPMVVVGIVATGAGAGGALSSLFLGLAALSVVALLLAR